MKRYKLVIAYDGTDYCGWQAQPGTKTVAGTLQDAIKRVFGSSILIIGASRTDSGVHARGQIATCLADFPASPDSVMHAWNNQLPPAIVIQSLEIVDSAHSIFADIAYKTYKYRLFFKRPAPFDTRYGWFVPRRINNIALLESALQVFVGTHDFRSFSTGDDRGDDTIRTIDSITIEHEANALVIVVKGQKFLHHMVRRIVGAACDVASRPDFSVDCLARILLEKNPRQRLTNAPAQGLTLESITYKSMELR
ncbi:tRNA pseudouridine(38-40) synthase TruA [Candidatus Dependentiae bacterium]|nr:tRNA pseudouridine(38-40) synthase TruA [Candidatus Dependentiae bacterium]